MGGPEPILMLFKFRNPYGKMDRPLPDSSPPVSQITGLLPPQSYANRFETLKPPPPLPEIV